jgi:hypothetical protein
VYNALYDDNIEIVLSPGNSDEEHFPTMGDATERRMRQSAGSKTASAILWGRAPLPTTAGPYMADLRAGKLYVVFLYQIFGTGELAWLSQEFNVGE